MSENQLIVSNAEQGRFKKAIINIQNALFFSKGSFNVFHIRRARKKLIFSFEKVSNISNVTDNTKIEKIQKTYEKNFEQYLTAIDKHISNDIYERVKQNKGTYEENKLIEQYLQIVELRNVDFMEYKYAKQRFLINKDLPNALKTYNLLYIEIYKKFYFQKMEEIYKTLLKTYSLRIVQNENDEKTYDMMFEEIEDYVLNILPYGITKNDKTKQDLLESKNKLEQYKYESKSINKIKYIEKELLILAISRDLFTYSFPIVVAEQCYIKLLKEARRAIIDADTYEEIKEAYNLVISLIEQYNVKLLSKKTYWEDPKIREEYMTFWKEYQRIDKLLNIDYDEYCRQKESLFIYYDLKLLNRVNTNKYDEIKYFYRGKLNELNGLRKLKNRYLKLEGKYILQKDR